MNNSGNKSFKKVLTFSVSLTLGLTLSIGTLHADSVKESMCKALAESGKQIAIARNLKVPLSAIIKADLEMNLSPEITLLIIELAKVVYQTDLSPENIEVSTFETCMSNN